MMLHKDGASHIDATTWKWAIAIHPSDAVDPEMFSSTLSFIAETERLAWKAWWRLAGDECSLENFIQKRKQLGDRAVKIEVRVVCKGDGDGEK